MIGCYVSKTATIAAGASLSDAVDIDGWKFMAFEMPAEWDAASMTYQASIDNVTFKDLYMDGAEVTGTVTASKVCAVNLNALAFAAVRYIKIRSGTAATPVNQTAERKINVWLSY
jgi:hypothetical protein